MCLHRKNTMLAECAGISTRLTHAEIYVLLLCVFLAEQYIMCLKKWIGSCPLGTRWYNFQPPTLTLRATIHFVTDGRTDRRCMMSIAAHITWQYGQLKTEKIAICINCSLTKYTTQIRQDSPTASLPECTRSDNRAPASSLSMTSAPSFSVASSHRTPVATRWILSLFEYSNCNNHTTLITHTSEYYQTYCKQIAQDPPIIKIMLRPMSIGLPSWQSHCKSSIFHATNAAHKHQLTFICNTPHWDRRLSWPWWFLNHYHHHDQYHTKNSSFTLKFIQESIANAKVSTRQPWYIGRNSLNQPSLRNTQQYQRNLYIAEKYLQCATIPSLTMCISLQSCAKFQENLNL